MKIAFAGPALVACMIAIAVPVEADRIDAGPASADFETNGDPARYDDNGTPLFFGDDQVDIFQTVRRVGVQVRAPPPVPGTSASVDFQNLTIDQPVFKLIDQTDEATYDSYAPEPVRRTFDIEFAEYTYVVELNIYTPVYQDEICEGDYCDLPYGLFLKYDQVKFPSGVYGTDIDGAIHFLNFSANLCPSKLTKGTEPCTYEYVPFPDQLLYDSTPNILVGYAVHNGTVEITNETPSSSPEGSHTTGFISQLAGADATSGWVLLDSSPELSRASQPWIQEESKALDATRVATASSPVVAIPSVFQSPMPPEPVLVLLALAVAAIPLYLLYSRLGRDKVLQSELRKKVYEAIETHPGIQQAELAALLKVGRQRLDHHLQHLRREGYIVILTLGRKKCLYKNGETFKPMEQLIYGLFRNHRTKQVVKVLSRGERISQTELAERLGIHKSTVRWHLDRLEHHKLAHVERQGRESFAVLDPEARALCLSKFFSTS